MLVNGKQEDPSLARFVCPPAFVHFTIVICISRDITKTTYWPGCGKPVIKCIFSVLSQKRQNFPQKLESSLLSCDLPIVTKSGLPCPGK